MTETAARVFVLETTRLNIADARKFGDLELLFDLDDRRSSIWSPSFPVEVLKVLETKKYDPHKDFFLVVGKMVPLVMTVVALVLKYKVIRVLFWVAPEYTYTCKELGDLEQLRDYIGETE